MKKLLLILTVLLISFSAKAINIEIIEEFKDNDNYCAYVLVKDFDGKNEAHWKKVKDFYVNKYWKVKKSSCDMIFFTDINIIPRAITCKKDFHTFMQNNFLVEENNNKIIAYWCCGTEGTALRYPVKATIDMFN